MQVPSAILTIDDRVSQPSGRLALYNIISSVVPVLAWNFGNGPKAKS